MAGLVKLIDEKGKLVFLAARGFILLAGLIHLSRFEVSGVVMVGGVAIPLQGYKEGRLGCCTSRQMGSGTWYNVIQMHAHAPQFSGAHTELNGATEGRVSKNR